MKPVIEREYRNWRVVSWKPVRFSVKATQLDNPFMSGYVMANSPKEAFEEMKKRGNKVYGVKNRSGEYVYPPQLVKNLESQREAAKDIPF